MVVSTITDMDEAPRTQSEFAVVFGYGLLTNGSHEDENMCAILWGRAHGSPLSHADTFLGFVALERVSKETGLIPRSTALVIIRGQYWGGMESLRRMAFAVPYETPMSSAKTERVGQRLMMVSCVILRRYNLYRLSSIGPNQENYDLYLYVGV